MEIQFSFNAKLENTSLTGAVVRCVFEEIGCGRETAYDLQLAVCESINNIIMHGYKEDDSKAISLKAKLMPDKIILKVEDHGIKIPPEKLETLTQDTANIEDMFLGEIEDNDNKANTNAGLGLLLIRRAFDDISYHPGARKNILTLVKHLT